MSVLAFLCDLLKKVMRTKKVAMVLPFICYYRKRGSASYIVREVHSVRERER